jgi:hypothetical protein
MGADFRACGETPEIVQQFALAHTEIIRGCGHHRTGTRPGGIVIRAAGAGSESICGTLDNTDIYKTKRAVLLKK